jgi:ribosome-associated heat shock protein Hsp15
LRKISHKGFAQVGLVGKFCAMCKSPRLGGGFLFIFAGWNGQGMEMTDKVRIDKWLWAVRIYKTRSQAAEACKKGRILISGMEVKPSREIKPGDIIFVRKLPVIYTYKILQPVENRLPAPRVKEFAEDLTSPEELAKLDIRETVFFKRDRGTGRPTKKERRLLDDIFNKGRGTGD